MGAGLQHVQVLVEGADDAVLAAAHSQAQAPPLAHAPHDHLGAVPLGQELPPDLLQVLGAEVAAADLALPLKKAWPFQLVKATARCSLIAGSNLSSRRPWQST